MITPDRWAEADGLIDDLLALPAAARRPALDARRGLDPELRAFVEAVLAEAEVTDPFLDPAGIERRPLVDDLVGRFATDRGDTLSPGTAFGPYEVIALAGRGGMGEVYRAHDPRLERDVALKTLPLDFEDDPERAARFDREARVLAALNHPNIATIHGVADDGGVRALVLEFVAGETLAEIIARGPVRLTDAIAWTRQVALAIQAAHDRGIVHRDLKPSNVRVAPGGLVKVLDFGLAKAHGPAVTAHQQDDRLTEIWKPDGAVLGTPAYMAPEQALGEPAGEAADAWALGCLLYELLTGVHPFEADTRAEVVRRIVAREPDLTRLPAATPDWVRKLVTGLLLKDPVRRLSAAAVVAEIERRQGGVDAHGRWWMRPAAMLVVVLGAVAAAGFFAVTRWRGVVPSPAPVRLAVPVPASDALLLSGQPMAAISPDGTTIVYRAVRHGRVFLFVRTLDAVESRPIHDTENAAAPFFSPDGAWIGFDGDGSLRKVRLDGGPAETLCDARGGATASWAGDVVVFSTATGRVLQLVSAAGGVPQPLTTLDAGRGDVAHAFPHLLPAADAALYTVVTASGSRQVAVVDLASRETRVLTEGSQPRLLGDHLLFVRNDTLWAAAFDQRRRALRGEARPVLNRLDTAGGSAVHYAVSEDGTLIYVPRRDEVRDRRLVWVDRRGSETLLPLEPRRYQRATLSPDGRRVALALTEGENTDLWLGDVNQGTLTRLTTEPTTDTAPLWTPDGRGLVFRSDRDGGGLFVVAIDRPGEVRRLTNSGQSMHTAHGWAPDARTLLFTEFRSYTEQVFAAVSMDGGPPRPLVSGAFAQLRPQVSPDGRWIAYQSDESGRYEIYLRPWPSLSGEAVKISVDGGTSPRWGPDGRELLYYDGRSIRSIPRHPNTGLPLSIEATRLFDYAPYTGRVGPDFDLTPDGARFLMIRPAEDTPASRAQLVLVQHWAQELRTLPAR